MNAKIITGVLALSLMATPIASAYQDEGIPNLRNLNNHPRVLEQVANEFGMTVEEFKADFNPDEMTLLQYGDSKGVDLRAYKQYYDLYRQDYYHRGMLREIVTQTDLTFEDVTNELQEGKTPAQIVEENEVNVDQLKQRHMRFMLKEKFQDLKDAFKRFRAHLNNN